MTARAHDADGGPGWLPDPDATDTHLLATNDDMTHIVEIFDIRPELDDEPEWMVFCRTHHRNVHDDPADTISDAIEWAEGHITRWER